MNKTIINMTDEELTEHYYDMATLSITEGNEKDIDYFSDLILEMARRFARIKSSL